MQKITWILIFLGLITICSCVSGQSVTPVKDDIYCLSAIISYGRDTNTAMTDLARQCCPRGHKVISQHTERSPYGQKHVIWHISCERDK